MKKPTQPVLFLSHGSPMMGIEDSPTADFLRQLGQSLPKPDAIVVFSAHLDLRSGIMITSGQWPETIHDFYGFPAPLYDLTYPAPGDPALAEDIAQRFRQNGLSPVLDDKQGWDHGVWMPLKLMYPDAEIPVVQVSINSPLGAQAQLRYGQLIGDLREQNVLIIGSGGISHNLREVFNPRPDPQRHEKVEAFTDWVYEQLTHQQTDALCDYLERAPYARFNHPTQEHFLPLFAALGAADGGQGIRIHKDTELDILALDCYRFD